MIATYFSEPLSSKRDRKFTITLLSLCMVYIMPIILADRYYIDDLGRSQQGYTSWSDNGRPLANLLMYLLGFGGENVVDISPLTQVFSVLVFVFSSYHYFKSNFRDISPVFSAVILFFAFANPFLLENLSYKFDSLPMIMALSLLMIAFVKINSKAKSWFLSVIVILASLCLYQAAIGFFVCLAVMEFVQQYIKPTPYLRNTFSIYKCIVVRIAQLLSAYIVYAVLIAPQYITGDYNVSHSKSIELNEQGLNIVLKNIDAVFLKILSHFGSLRYQLVVVFLFLFLWLFIVFFKRFRNAGKVSILGDIIPSVIVLISPFLIFLFSFLHVSLLANPVFACRTLVSFSGVMLFVGWMFFYIVKRWHMAIVFIMPIILFFFVFSYSYGNALNAQKDFDASLASDIVSNINDIDLTSSKLVGVYGIQPSSSVRDNAVKRYPLIGHLVPIYMGDWWHWGEVLLNHYGLKNKRGATVSVELMCTMIPSIKKANYTLFSNQSLIIIAFKQPNCN